MDVEQIRSIDVINGVINPLPSVSDPGDKGLNVMFKMHSHFDDVKTREQGRPIFEMREYILIQIPGDTTGNVFRPIREDDKLRFPEQYMRFKVGQEQVTGTPLTEWPQITRAQCDELAYFKIVTVEQLANLSDQNAQRFMGLHQLRDKAKKYLEQVVLDAPMNKMEAELQSRDEQISTLTNQLQEMQRQLGELMARQSQPQQPEQTDTPAPVRRPRKTTQEERADVDA